MVGMCTGLLAASAASVNIHSTSFVSLAVEVVRIALRIGFVVAETSERLCMGDSGGEECCSVIVAGVSDLEARIAIKEFCEDGVCQYSKQRGTLLIFFRDYHFISAHISVPLALRVLQLAVRQL
jgi:hypothetical protein